MNPWHDFDPKRLSPESFMAIIEIPKGSKKKYELDKQTGLLILDRIFNTTAKSVTFELCPNTAAAKGIPKKPLLPKIEQKRSIPCFFASVSCFQSGLDSINSRKIIPIPIPNTVKISMASSLVSCTFIVVVITI